MHAMLLGQEVLAAGAPAPFEAMQDATRAPKPPASPSAFWSSAGDKGFATTLGCFPVHERDEASDVVQW